MKANIQSLLSLIISFLTIIGVIVGYFKTMHDVKREISSDKMAYIKNVNETIIPLIPPLSDKNDPDKQWIAFQHIIYIADNAPLASNDNDGIAQKKELMTLIMNIGKRINVSSSVKIKFLDQLDIDKSTKSFYKEYFKNKDDIRNWADNSAEKNDEITKSDGRDAPSNDAEEIANKIPVASSSNNTAPDIGWIYAGHFYPAKTKSGKSNIVGGLNLESIINNENNKDKIEKEFDINPLKAQEVSTLIGDVYMRDSYPVTNPDGTRVWGSILSVLKAGDIIEYNKIYIDRPEGKGEDKPYTVWLHISKVTKN